MLCRALGRAAAVLVGVCSRITAARRCLGVSFVDDEFRVLMEEFSMTLREFTRRQCGGRSGFAFFDLVSTLDVLHQVALGLACLHTQSPPMYHRNLTMGSIFVQRSSLSMHELEKLRHQPLSSTKVRTDAPPEYTIRRVAIGGFGVFNVGHVKELLRNAARLSSGDMRSAMSSSESVHSANTPSPPPNKRGAQAPAAPAVAAAVHKAKSARRAAELGASIDVFAYGLVIYELLTGTPLLDDVVFDSDLTEHMDAVSVPLSLPFDASESAHTEQLVALMNECVALRDDAPTNGVELADRIAEIIMHSENDEH